jgi:hydrogenase maturation factor HypF (carbamoyltransferase family)
MGLIKELMETWRIEMDKRKEQKEKYRIEYAFTCGGTKYYRFADIANLPYERGMMAMLAFDELRMRCSREFLVQYADTIDKLLHEQKIDIFKIQKLNELLKQRLTLATEIDLMYKLASVVFFDKSENTAVYEPAYAEKKIAKWRKDKGVTDFFTQKPLLELMPFLQNANTDLDSYSAMLEELNKIHSECLRLASSEKK